MTLDIRGHTVRRDGETVATLTYTGSYTSVRVDGKVVGRIVELSMGPASGPRFDAYTARHPVVPTPTDTRLATEVLDVDAIQAVLDNHAQAGRHQTTIRYQDSRYFPGESTLVTAQGENGETHTEVTLADLEELQDQTHRRIAALRERRGEVRSDG